MKYRMFVGCLVLTLLFSACSSASNDEESTPELSTMAEIKQISFSYKNSLFEAGISGDQITLKRDLPREALLLMVHSLLLSPGATADVSKGMSIDCHGNSQMVQVTAEDGKTIKRYTVHFPKRIYQSVVEHHGGLKVEGNRIVGKNNESVSLAGNSFYWTNNGWGGNRFYNRSVVEWLKIDWGTTIIRAAMGVEDNGGYLQFRAENRGRVETLVDAAIEHGLYVVIDWHSHYAHLYESEAIAFFTAMAEKYGAFNNVIYEIYNEPKYIDVTPANDGKFATWNSHIKPYAEKVIAAIREKDPDNLIVVGTGEWSQKVDDAASNPIMGYCNIAYVLHFYSVHHKQWLRDRATQAMQKGLAIMVTEWGPLGNTFNDAETQSWMEWCKANQLIHCSWAVNDKVEPWSIVKQGAAALGQWSDNQLTEAGSLEREIVRNW